MAEQTYSNILFSADFDPKQYIEGIEQMISSVKKLGEQESSLKKTLSDTVAQLQANEEAQHKLQKANDEAATSGRKNTEQTQKLTAELQKLKDENAALVQSINNQKAALEGVAQKGKEVESSYERVRKVVQQLQQQAGQPVKLTINDGDIINALQDVRGYFKAFAEGVDWSNISDNLKAQVLTAKSDIEGLTLFAEAANAKLAAMDPGTEGYDELQAAVSEVNGMLEAYNVLLDETGQQQEDTGKGAVSLRTRLKGLRDELTLLEDAGLDNTETYREMQLEAAALTDQYGDMQQRLRILASDTKKLDFGLSSLQAAATGYQALVGAQELFGLSTEGAAEAQRKLLAVMNLVQGAQQLMNLLNKDSIIRLEGANIATKAYAATQRVLATSLGLSATAARTLSTVLLTTGVGALVVGLGFLIAKLSDLTSANDDAAESTKRLAEEQRALKEAIDDTFANSQAEINRRIAVVRNEEAIKLLEAQGAKQSQINNLKRETINLELESLRVQLAGKDGLLSPQEELKLKEQIYRKEQELLRIGKERSKSGSGGKGAENVYAKELARLNEELAKVKDGDFLSEGIIRERFQAALEKQFQQIDEYLKKKQLTKPQADKLKALIRQITDINAEKEIENFQKQVEQVKAGIEKTLFDLRFEDREKRIAAIQDEFKQETAVIAAEASKQRQELAVRKREAFDSLADDLAKGFINKTQFDSYAQELNELYDKLLDDVATEAAIKNAQLAEKVFTASLDELETTIKNSGVVISEGNNELIQSLSKQYLSGELSYKDYQERLTDILKAETRKRKEIELQAIEEQIRAIDERMLSQKLSPEAQKAEQERLRALRERRAALNREIATGEADEKNSEENKRIQGIVNYVQAVGGFIDQVINFWRTANEAEQRSIERSIALQDKRVAAAQKVAERGNAAYLKMEEEKQQELLIKQENAARRQMAINAALQASQLLVAVTGAVAKIATPGVGAVDVIASIGVIVGALASGYALVKSLQANQPSFFQGTDYVQGRRDFTRNTARIHRKGERAGRDTIPAWLHEGESVNDVETTASYHPTIKAIQSGSIPADVINGIVNTYPRWNMPTLAVDRMQAAAQVHIMQDARMFEAMKENTREMKRVHKAIKGMGINATLDAKGFSLAVQGFIVQHDLNKKA